MKEYPVTNKAITPHEKINFSVVVYCFVVNLAIASSNFVKCVYYDLSSKLARLRNSNEISSLIAVDIETIGTIEGKVTFYVLHLQSILVLVSQFETHFFYLDKLFK